MCRRAVGKICTGVMEELSASKNTLRMDAVRYPKRFKISTRLHSGT
jgi:hypothetical protein